MKRCAINQNPPVGIRVTGCLRTFPISRLVESYPLEHTVMLVRGLKAALNGDGRYMYKVPEYVVDHLVVGGGSCVFL